MAPEVTPPPVCETPVTTARQLPKGASAATRAIAAACLLLYKAVVYVLSFVGPVYLVTSAWPALNAISLIAVALSGWLLSGLTFLVLLILTKKLFIGNVSEVGCGTIASPLIRRWFPAAMLIATLDNSPFRSMTTGMSFVGPWFYRAMGAKMPNSVLIGGRTLIYDPWFLELGENVTIGTGATILGHVGDGPDVKLGKVVIEAGAVIGVNSVIFPDVRVGENARVAAGAVVVRGARIGSGEVWGGIPARRLSVRAASVTGAETRLPASTNAHLTYGSL